MDCADNCRKNPNLEWNGNRFSASLVHEGQTLLTIQGEISADESSLNSFQYETFLFPTKIWAENLPLVSRTAAGLVYQVTGAQVSEHVGGETKGFFDSCTEDTIIADQSSFIRITVPR